MLGDLNAVEKRFERIGARARVEPAIPWRRFSIDVASERRGEFFEVRVTPDRTVEVLDVRPRDRHLLLLVRGEEKARYLCGHDERHWFVAAIPESRPASTVAEAKDALKPPEVLAAERRIGRKLRSRRRNPAYIRQGEWFFVPSDIEIDPRHVRGSAPLWGGARRTPHVAEEVAWLSAETVYACSRYPQGLTKGEYSRVLESSPRSIHYGWRTEVRNLGIYARGRVTHPDHRTVVLKGWHHVYLNTENDSRARADLAFLD